MQVSWFKSNLLSITNRAFVFTSMSSSIAFLTFHLNILDLVFDLDFSDHLAGSATYWTSMKSSCCITGTFAVLANLSSSETVYGVASCVKSWQGDGHVGSEITSLWFGSFFDLGKTFLSEKVVSISFGYVNEDFVGAFDLDKHFLDVLVTSISVRMVLDWKFSECLFYLIAGCLWCKFE